MPPGRRRDLGTTVRKTANGAATFAWLGMVPVAIWLGWLESVAFVSACSIYANAASHLAAWLADVNPELARIEEKVDRLLERE